MKNGPLSFRQVFAVERRRERGVQALAKLPLGRCRSANRVVFFFACDRRWPCRSFDPMSEELHPVDMTKIGSHGYVFDRRTLFGYQPLREDGTRFATLWWTLFGLPIIPLGRYLVKEWDHEYGNTFRNVDLSRRIRQHPAAVHDLATRRLLRTRILGGSSMNTDTLPDQQR
jgi:hypothetical protein